MIKTKRELALEALSGYDIREKFVRVVFFKALSMPEIDFIKKI